MKKIAKIGKIWRKAQFTDPFCTFFKKSSYLIDCGVEGTQIWGGIIKSAVVGQKNYFRV